MKAFRILLRFFGGLFALLLIFLIIATILAVITDFKPPKQVILQPEGKPLHTVVTGDTISIMTWNIGYGGLGSSMDFFYDGGDHVRPPRDVYEGDFAGIVDFLEGADSLDFILLQEVDRNARRSYHQNQVSRLRELLPGYQSVFARNYDVQFVPVPVNNPMGRVVSGMMSFSVFDAVTSERMDFPGQYSFPKRLFMLDRCLIIQRYVTDNGNLLVVINTHNSAFDDGQLRKQEFDFLKKTALSEYRQGHYVVIGGDWNRNPPGYLPGSFSTGDTAVRNDLGPVPENFMPETWKWIFDSSAPTNRHVDQPYRKGETETTIVDYFLISPNIEATNVKTIRLGFRYTDHNPVQARFILLENGN